MPSGCLEGVGASQTDVPSSTAASLLKNRSAKDLPFNGHVLSQICSCYHAMCYRIFSPDLASLGFSSQRTLCMPSISNSKWITWCLLLWLLCREHRALKLEFIRSYMWDVRRCKCVVTHMDHLISVVVFMCEVACVSSATAASLRSLQ